jgi:outer membrane receptor for ferrienterochelin and colicin
MRQILFYFLFVFLSLLQLFAQVSNSDILVTIHAKESKLGDVLKELSDKYSVNFYYSSSKLPVDQLITLDIDNQPLTVFLEKVKASTDINYQVTGSKIILFEDEQKSKQKGNISIYGFVEDSLTGERLIGAYVSIKDIPHGTVTNVYGYYSLPLRTGEYLVRCSYIGYIPVERYFKLDKNVFAGFKLQPDLQPINEIKVSGKILDKISSISTGTDEIPLKMMRTYPALLGENDPVQFLKMLPGILCGSEASNGLYVRGSPPNQTSFILDDAVLFNISHISGLFSSINPDAVKELYIYKSHLPSRYGGVLASVVDIRLRDGNNQHYSATGGFGTIASRLTVEGPIIRDKASFIVSARRSYFGEFLRLISTDPSTGNIYFYDLNSKINYTLNTRNRFYLSAYLSKDDALTNLEGTDWTNSMISFRWNHVYSGKLFSNLTLTGSKYTHQFMINNVDNYTIKTTFKNYALKYDLSYYPVEKYQIDFGLCTNYQTILPMEITLKNNPKIVAPYYSGILDRTIYNAYAENIIHLTSAMALEAGIRFNYLHNYSAELGNPVLKPEPFLLARYKISRLSSVKAGYSHNYQFYHGESIINMIVPFDMIIFTNNTLRPQYSDNFTLGYYFNSVKDLFEISLEGYYKKLYNQCRFRITQDIMIGEINYDQAIIGKSEAYGLEFSLRRTIGKLTGMINYTLSKVIKKEDGQFGNQTYNPYYDRPHNLSVNLNFQLSRRIIMMSSWVYLSGCPYNMPIGKYMINGTSVPAFELETLRPLRMPSYHHLDIGMQYQFGSKLHYKHSLSFFIYNVYNRKNLLYYTYRDVYDGNVSKNDDSNAQFKRFNAVGFYIFQFMPAFSYEFRFD